MPTSPLPNHVVEHFDELCRLPGLAGHEQRVAAYLTQHMTPHADNVHTDTLGNVTATLQGTDADAPTLMLFAHMDSLGFIVRKIDDDGYTRIHRLGGIPIKTLPATPVTLATPHDDIPGIIATKAHHVTPPAEKTTVTPIDDLYIDTGTTNKHETQNQGIDVGTPVTYRGHFERLGDHRVTATFIDNRSGCATLIEVARRLAAKRPAATVHLVATVQEEFNLRGASVAAHRLRPDAAICLDGSAAGDTPDLAHLSDVALGEGPMLNLYNFHGRGTLNGLLPHPALVRMTEAAAAHRELPLQRNANFGGLTDAAYVQLVGDGIAALDLGIPRRYLHSQREVCDLRDLSALIELCEGLLHAFEPGMRWARWG